MLMLCMCEALQAFVEYVSGHVILESLPQATPHSSVVCEARYHERFLSTTLSNGQPP